MPAYPKKTEQINFESWTTIQHKTTGAQFGDNAPLDDLAGPGPYLVFEEGAWKYPQQASVGRVDMPTGLARPVRLLLVMADFGASTTWSITVASPPANTSGTPYDAAHAALYTMDDVVVASGTSQYLSQSWNVGALDNALLIFPGQRLYLTTATAAAGATVRFTFSLAFDTKV